MRSEGSSSGSLSLRVRGFAGASAGKIGMWVFLASDAMGFGGLLLAYALLRVRAPSWPDPAARFDRPLAAALTFVLLFSGATMTAALAMARDARWKAARLLLWITALAGLIFVVGQAVEFQSLATGRRVGLTADHAAAAFYVITGYHGLHVLIGAAVLLWVAGRAPSSESPSESPLAATAPAKSRTRVASALPPPVKHAPAVGHQPAEFVRAVEVASLYWQFVDLVWVVVFTLLYLLPPVAPG